MCVRRARRSAAALVTAQSGAAHGVATQGATAVTVRLALGVEYDGAGFRGWQRLTPHGQPSPDTLQGALEAALASVANAPIDTICAGRTDAGVHAQCQVVHFDTDVVRTPRGWTLGTTTQLPPSMCVRWCVAVDAAFHARFSARARRYRYRILNRPVRPALGRELLTWIRQPLDADAMHVAAQALVGEHDFTSFRTVHCQAAHARRELQRIVVTRSGEMIEIEVQANAFLHHMVRNIVGSLLAVGMSERPAAWVGEVLAARDRTVAGPTAPASGLVFVGPLYPDTWRLPSEVTLGPSTQR